MSTHESQEHQASSCGVKKCTHLERLGMDDRNVALSEHAMINDAETTDYDDPESKILCSMNLFA